MPRKNTAAGASLNALFIGNSFTARNNLPGLVQLLAAAAGVQLSYKLISIGGASLRTHWNRGEAAAEIERGGYDFVVLQEQSTLPIKNAKRMHENVRLFDERINASGAKTALYMTWARQTAPEAQADITDAYTSIGHEIGATVIPAGMAWQKCLQLSEHPILHDRDGSHPTLAGSYLAASVAFAVLFRRSPASLKVQIDGLANDEMLVLQKVAAQIVGC